MFNKHLLKFGVNGGEDDREKNVGNKKFERLAILRVHVCVCVCIHL